MRPPFEKASIEKESVVKCYYIYINGRAAKFFSVVTFSMAPTS